MKPDRGYEALRRFRASRPHTDYFFTLCTNDRKVGLTDPTVATPVRVEIENIEGDGSWTIRGAVIMPDHLHLLLTLHDRLTLGRAVARLKAKSKPVLAAANLRWQGNYYEHRLRDCDAVETVLMYIFLNPYRAGLVTASAVYPWFWLGVQEAAWFKPRLDDGRPYPEWLC